MWPGHLGTTWWYSPYIIRVENVTVPPGVTLTLHEGTWVVSEVITHGWFSDYGWSEVGTVHIQGTLIAEGWSDNEVWLDETGFVFENGSRGLLNHVYVNGYIGIADTANVTIRNSVLFQYPSSHGNFTGENNEYYKDASQRAPKVVEDSLCSFGAWAEGGGFMATLSLYGVTRIAEYYDYYSSRRKLQARKEARR